MALYEALTLTALVPKARINNHLREKHPSRTLETIKVRQKAEDHKQMVIEAIDGILTCTDEWVNDR